MGYKICLSTPGLNVFCQELLFNRGYKWATSETTVLNPEVGQHLYLKRGRITKTDLCHQEYFDQKDLKEITLEDIAKWPEVK